MLDLAPDGKNEVLLPDFTPNPVLAVVHFPCYLVYLKVNHLIYPIMYKLV
jgi:hypothetical protein